MSESEGRLLATRYRLLSQVGQGGMGTVWKACDELLDRLVAVKEVKISPGLSGTERELVHARTMREARAAARLSHPGIVTVHDVVDEDRRPWIVMEFIQARTLQEIIDRDGPIAPGRAAEIGRQVLAALRAAHAAQILHRDVKPSNVLLVTDADQAGTGHADQAGHVDQADRAGRERADRAGRGGGSTGEERAILTDFGIASLVGDTTLTQTGQVMGSPAYMAPERVRGQAATPASDLWALGVMLYAACAGRSPYQGGDIVSTFAAILNTDPEPPPLAGPLGPVIRDLIVRDPAGRMTAGAAAERLGRIARNAQDTRDAGATRTALDTRTARQTRDAGTAWQAQDAGTAWQNRDASARPAGAGAPAMPVPSAPAMPVPSAAPITGPAAPPRPVPGGPAMPVPGGPGLAPAHFAPAPPPAGTSAWTDRSWSTGHTVLAGLAALVVAVAVVAAIMFWPLTAGARRAGPAPGTSPSTAAGAAPRTAAGGAPTTAAGGAPGKASAGKESPAPVPAGFVERQEAGYVVVVPEGWTRRVEGNSVKWEAASGAYVQVDATPWTGSAYAHWQAFERQARANGTLPAYRRIQLRSIVYRDYDAADLEFTWLRHGRDPMHGLDRGVVADGRPYAIFFAAPELRWDEYADYREVIFGSFRTTAGAAN
jgi:hypothetical protein